MNDIDFDYPIDAKRHLSLKVVEIEGIVRSKQDVQLPDITYGLGTHSCMRLFTTYYKIFEYHKNAEDRHPVCYMANEELMSSQWANMSRTTFYKCKEKLVQLGLVQCIVRDTYRQGKVSCVYPTEDGWAKYHKIKADRLKKVEKKEKQQVVKYTDQDMENAKFWFKSLRRYWQGSAGKLKQIGSWEKQKEIRANAARKAREKLEITAEEFMTILKRIVDSSEADFYLSNVLGPNKFNDKWANGTVAETMQQKIEELDKKDEKQSYLILNGAEDIPEDCTEDEEEMWKIMWRVIGHRLIKNFVKKGQEKFDEYYDCLANICTELVECEVRESNIAKLRFKNKDVKRKFDAEQDKYKSAYFYFLLDKYNYTDCLFLSDMILNSWWDFWNMVEPNMSSQTREELTPRTFTINDDMPA